MEVIGVAQANIHARPNSAPLNPHYRSIAPAGTQSYDAFTAFVRKRQHRGTRGIALLSVFQIIPERG
jgi:hypothetical protein